MTIAGVTVGSAEPNWGQPEKVIANSGYSLGAVQVDLGQRGTWPLGATEDAPLRGGQTTYVDAVIAQAARYAQEHHLKFAADKIQLRADLLTHGNGEDGRSTLVFIDTDTRDSFNAWASSPDGQKWIHRNMDYPQVLNATRQALDLLNADGRNIPQDRRLETIAILAKTANQMPAQLAVFRQLLRDGGNYDDVLAKANEIHSHHAYYAGPKAAALAERYKTKDMDARLSTALDRAHAMVASPDFDPSVAASDPDFQSALKAVGQAPPIHVLRQGAQGDDVATLQANLIALGLTGTDGRALQPDGVFGARTREAVAAFQDMHGLRVDGLAGPATQRVLQETVQQQGATLADCSHPGNALFCQALQGVHLVDARCGRTPDAWSDNLAASLATAAHAKGLERIDHVVLGDNATRAFAVQGDAGSPFRQFACVDILQAIAKPLERSSVEFGAPMQPAVAQNAREAQVPPSLAQSSRADPSR